MFNHPQVPSTGFGRRSGSSAWQRLSAKGLSLLFHDLGWHAFHT
ncbi:hypothetical protein SynMITS9220_01236 [Synechococcus sp. MIT S9220]|nr:hypothetical protein SynMITS9220_01236 [Synechococcus sp. MIT S9220]